MGILSDRNESVNQRTPLRIADIIPDPEERKAVEAEFWSKVDTSGEKYACHPWAGTTYKANGGYGRFRLPGGLEIGTHRLAFILHHGGLPDRRMFVTHKVCDNPICCNPLHLRAATNRDNQRDAVRHRRHRNVALSPEAVRAMRRMHSGGVGAADLAERYGVHHSTVVRLLRADTWASVEDSEVA